MKSVVKDHMTCRVFGKIAFRGDQNRLNELEVEESDVWRSKFLGLRFCNFRTKSHYHEYLVAQK